MSRPNGVVDTRFDEAGFEVPFAGTFEGEAHSDSEQTFRAETESPFAESTFAGEGFEGEPLAKADSWSEGEEFADEAPLGEDEAFPSGLVLQPASGATG